MPMEIICLEIQGEYIGQQRRQGAGNIPTALEPRLLGVCSGAARRDFFSLPLFATARIVRDPVMNVP